MFFSNNSSLQYYCTDQQQQQQQQQPMYNVDRQQQAAFLSDVSPNSSSSSPQLYHQHYPPQCPPHYQSLASSFHFSPAPTFIDHNDYEEYYFPLFHLQQQQNQQQQQDLLVGHHHHFSQQQQQELEQQQDHHNLQPHLTTLDMETSSNKVITILDHGEGGGGTRSLSPTTKMSGGDTMTIPWKRASKKDRHSKIVTAQGPRDRRMRLSLEIARRFFKLQDMLKFDKASKTVEWLLTNSKGAIKELSRSLSSSSKKNIVTKGSCSTTSSGGGGGLGCSRASSEKVSSVSECEVVCDDQFEITNVHEDLQVQAAGNKVKKEKHVMRGAVRKATFNPPLAKESRAKARARARERTIEKMRSRSSVQSPHQGITICTSNQLRSSSSFETGEESGNSQSQDMRSSLEMVAHEADELISSHSLINECRRGSIVEESFVVSSNSMRSSLFDYDHEMKTSSQGLNINNNCNFSENWDFHNVRAQCNYYSMPNNVHDLSTDFHFMN